MGCVCTVFIFICIFNSVTFRVEFKLWMKMEETKTLYPLNKLLKDVYKIVVHTLCSFHLVLLLSLFWGTWEILHNHFPLWLHMLYSLCSLRAHFKYIKKDFFNVICIWLSYTWNVKWFGKEFRVLNIIYLNGSLGLVILS